MQIKQKKNSAIFWILIFLALIVGATLLVGIALEQQTFLISFLERIGFSSNHETSDAQPIVPADPKQAAKEVTQSPNKCSVKEIKLPTSKDSVLVGWSSDRFVVSFWTLKSDSQKLQLWTVESTSSDLHANVSTEQEVLCKQAQNSDCIFAEEGKTQLTKIQLEKGVGWGEVKSTAGFRKMVLVKDQSGKITFHSTLGLCGNHLTLEEKVTRESRHVIGNSEDLSLIVTHPTANAILEYDYGMARSPYSYTEIPVHPVRAWKLEGRSLRPFACEVSESKSGDTLGASSWNDETSSFALISAEGGLLASRTGLVLKRHKQDWSAMKFLKIPLQAEIETVNWISSTTLQISAKNIFGTQSRVLELDVESQFASKPAADQNQVAMRRIAARENHWSQQGKESILLFSQSLQSRDSFLRFKNGYELPMGTLSDLDDSMQLWSLRGPNRYLIVSQSETGSPITLTSVNCE